VVLVQQVVALFIVDFKKRCVELEFMGLCSVGDLIEDELGQSGSTVSTLGMIPRSCHESALN
jgi:hypothetical protein